MTVCGPCVGPIFSSQSRILLPAKAVLLPSQGRQHSCLPFALPRHAHTEWRHADTRGRRVYSFDTLEPASYAGRPKHIHVTVTAAGRLDTTLEMNFQDSILWPRRRIHHAGAKLRDYCHERLLALTPGHRLGHDSRWTPSVRLSYPARLGAGGFDVQGTLL
jgi:hypothetical protein